MAFTISWDETVPAGTADASDIDTFIQNVKTALRERLAFGGMYFPTAHDELAGEHSNVRMAEQASNPTSVANKSFLFVKDASAISELYFMDDAGTVLQITSNGKFLINNLRIASQAQGDVIYFDGTNWARLAPGTSGQFLKTQGAAANPVWGTPGDANDFVKSSFTSTGAVATDTVTIPDDDTIPQSGEGTEFMTLAHTPAATGNKLYIDVTICGGLSANAAVIAALFKDSDASALMAARFGITGSDGATIHFSYEMTAGTTSAITFKVRAGGGTGTFTFNGTSGARKLGGVLASSIKITEVKL